MASYTLSSAAVTAAIKVKGTQLTDPTLVLAKLSTSTAPVTAIAATCPEAGIAYVWFAPADTAAPTVTSTSVQSSVDTFVAST